MWGGVGLMDGSLDWGRMEASAKRKRQRTGALSNENQRTGAEDDEGDVGGVVPVLMCPPAVVEDDGPRQGRVPRGGLHRCFGRMSVLCVYVGERRDAHARRDARTKSNAHKETGAPSIHAHAWVCKHKDDVRRTEPAGEVDDAPPPQKALGVPRRVHLCVRVLKGGVDKRTGGEAIRRG